MRRYISWFLRGSAVVLGGIVVGLAAACSDGGGEASAEDIQAVEDTINQVFSSGSGEADFLLDHVTDNLIETVLFSTREECETNVDSCAGDPSPPTSVQGTTIDGDTASSTITLDFGVFDVELIKEDDVWKLDSLQAASDTVSADTPLVDLDLDEFSFDFDENAIPADSGFAFHITNKGRQSHEAVVASIPADVPLEEAIAGLGPEEPVGFKVFIQPDQVVDLAFASPLAPGRYALVCFFPDTESDAEDTTHADKGMVAEFTIE